MQEGREGTRVGGSEEGGREGTRYKPSRCDRDSRAAPHRNHRH